MNNVMVIFGLALLSIGTYFMRFAGAKLGGKLALSEQAQKLLSDAATTLLFTVAIAATFYESQHFAGIARIIGVAVGVFLAWQKIPLVLVILIAAMATAIIRYLGIS